MCVKCLKVIMAEKLSILEYNSLCLFAWDHETSEPFQVIGRTKEIEREIPEKWFSMSLKESARYQKRKISSLGDKTFSIFVKFEKGKTNIPFIGPATPIYLYFFLVQEYPLNDDQTLWQNTTAFSKN